MATNQKIQAVAAINRKLAVLADAWDRDAERKQVEVLHAFLHDYRQYLTSPDTLSPTTRDHFADILRLIRDSSS